MPPFRTGSKRGEKRAAEDIVGKYLDEVLADFSGQVAADELYDGPFCVLSIVDNHTFKRILYEVLDHSPTQDDIRAFFRRFQAALETRGRALAGITTDGWPRYPTPITDVFGRIPHQVCEFHVLKELSHAVLRAVAKVRKTLAAAMPPLGRGRPSPATQTTARRRQRLQERIQALFEHRHLFVQHCLTTGDKHILRHLPRKSPTPADQAGWSTTR